MSSSTLCEHCIFYKECDSEHKCYIDAYDNKSRLEVFKEFNLAEVQDNGKHKINTYCNTCRNIYWKEYIKDPNNIELLKNKVRQETKITYSAFINITHATINEVQQLIDTLYSYSIKPTEIVLFGKVFKDALTLSKWEKFLYYPEVKISLSIWDDRFQQCADAVRKTKGDYFLFLAPGIIPTFSPQELEDNTNSKLLPTLHCIHDTYYLVLAYVYKAYMYEPNPILAISQGLTNNDESESKCTNS